MSQGIFNLYHQDTTPGARSAFSPPESWSGEESEYITLMRDRYKAGGIETQQMNCVSFRLRHPGYSRVEITFDGPFKTAAEGICRKLAALHSPPKEA